MIDILLISDQPRLHGILTSAGKLPDGTLRVASSLHQGLELMSSKAPEILFLQNRLSGLAGYILVRHVREETGSASTKIILLTETTESGENSTADIELSTAVSDNELSDAVSEIIADQLGLHQNPANEPASTIEISPAPPLQTTAVVTDTVSLSTPGVSSTGPGTATIPTPMANPAKTSPAEEAHPSAILSSNPPPIQWERKRLVAAIAIILSIAVAIVLAVFLFKPADHKVIPSAAAIKPVPSPPKPLQTTLSSASVSQPADRKQAVAVLPSFVPPSAADPLYSAANPGWERYTSAKREYKIFREGGSLKAIQVLGKSRGGISPAFFRTAIKELANVRDYKTGSKEFKGDFLIKKGKLSNSADIIIYKNRSDTLLRAFVIYFKKQNVKADSKERQ